LRLSSLAVIIPMPLKKLTSGMVDISIYVSRENIGQQNDTSPSLRT
jgi:hypothetical protein